MKLNDLLLKKEELPILYENCFQIPIHPKLLDSNIKINEDIAKKIFPKVADEWYSDLNEYVKTQEKNFRRQWIEKIFLKHKPKIIQEGNYQYFLGFWRDQIQTLENGFVTSFSISRDGGGTIYFNKEDRNCETSIPGIYINFSEEKAKEFEYKKVGEFSVGLVYSEHNIDHYPSALFLRNWAIKYMNEIFKEVF